MRANPFEGQLERLARTLTEQFGVQVVCQGDNAWTDGDRIVIPSLPEPMDEILDRMMLGYLDHEMAHVAFSDFQVAEEFAKKHPGFDGVLNVVEDALIERRAMERWPGVLRNLDAMFAQIRDHVAVLIAQRGPFDRFCTAVYLWLSHHRDMLGLESEVCGFEDLLDQFPGVQTTRGAAVLAESVLRRWLEKNPPQAQPSLPKARSNAKGQQRPRQHAHGQERPPAESGSGDTPTNPSGGTSDRGQTENGQPQGPTDESDPAGVNRKTKPLSSRVKARRRRQQPQESDSARKARPASGKPSTVPGEGADENRQVEETADSAQHSGGGAGGSPGRSLIGEALAEVILERVAHISSTGQYRPFTKQYDRIERVPRAYEAEVQTLLDTNRDTARRLRRGLTNALRSAEKRWWKDDQLRGELSPRTLHRLCTDRSRLDVFRTRSMIQGRSTAVSILLDASGSMSRRKMDVARSAMRVILEALGDLRIAAEALTFTTGNQVDIAQLTHQTGLDVYKLRERYARLSNLEIGLVKEFAETVKAAFARLPAVHGTGLTPLGEAMGIAAARLAPRQETRKILLVLTDGKAGCEGGSDAATAHAQVLAKRIIKAGIELVGVGILDDNVCQVIADSIVIQALEELPAQLCKLLGRTLRKGLRHVG